MFTALLVPVRSVPNLSIHFESVATRFAELSSRATWTGSGRARAVLF